MGEHTSWGTHNNLQSTQQYNMAVDTFQQAVRSIFIVINYTHNCTHSTVNEGSSNTDIFN